MKGNTTFEQELRRIFDEMDCFEQDGVKYIGRAVYGKFDDELRLKAQFTTLNVMDHYSALKLEVIKRNEGVIDTNVIRFSEFWGKKPTTNPNFKDGVHPFLWKDGDKLDWYVYTPTGKDIAELREAVKEYVSVFQTEDMYQGMNGMRGM